MDQEVSDRRAEIAKYQDAYKRPKYRMGAERLAASRRAMLDYGTGWGRYLDVGAGRGEMLRFAQGLDFQVVVGTEVVRELLESDMRLRYAEAHNLPFGGASFDVVTCFDVLEHLLPEDVQPAIDELFRVAEQVVIASAAKDSQLLDGVEHHVSRRPLDQWRKLLTQRGLLLGWKLRETRPCRKGSDLWIFTKDRP
jgi:ubiquinone/menaquinone biosynthesis C-methylase UbiE